MNAYTFTLFVHVGAAAVLIGSSLAFPVVLGSLKSAESVREVKSFLGQAERLTRANPLASLVLLGTGVYLGSVGWWTSGWFAAAVGLYLVNAAYAARLVIRESRRIGEAAATCPEGPVTPALDELRESERLELGADILLGADVAVLFLMIEKPGPLASAIVAILGVGSAFARRVLRRRARTLAMAR